MRKAVWLIVMCVLFAPNMALGSFQEEALDYLVQDVCEVHGQPSSKGPLNCPGTLRDLKVGEQLRYHKHDWPNVHDLASRPGGYQRGNSFPIDWEQYRVVIHTFDHSGGQREFGRFDPGDGGDLYIVGESSVNIALTETSKGLYMFLGPHCGPRPSLGNLLDSWVVLRTPIDGGSTVAALHLSQDRSCPLRYSRSHTDWRTRAIRYRATLEGALTEPIKTIITDHFSQETPERSATMERFYFTQELGVTRWEKWQNFAHPSAPSTAAVREQRLVESGRCGVREGGPSRSWHLLDCREFTNIVPAQSESGDAPVFWIDRLREHSRNGKF